MSVDLAIKNRTTFESYAGGFGLVLDVKNNGQHWIFTRPNGDPLLLEWWPSTGRFVVNKNFRQAERAWAVQDVRKLLERFCKCAPTIPPPYEQTRLPDVKPRWNKKCQCGASPTVGDSGLCGPCFFGEAATMGGNW